MQLMLISNPHNKRMQSDQTTRYARGLAADARRYVVKKSLSYSGGFDELSKL